MKKNLGRSIQSSFGYAVLGQHSQLPAVALAEGIAVGSTGATVSGAALIEGIALIVGIAVAVGVAAVVGDAAGFCVGIVALPRTEQVQPVTASSSASSGIKKNRFICASPFGSFPIVCAQFFNLCKKRTACPAVLQRNGYSCSVGYSALPVILRLMILPMRFNAYGPTSFIISSAVCMSLAAGRSRLR